MSRFNSNQLTDYKDCLGEVSFIGNNKKNVFTGKTQSIKNNLFKIKVKNKIFLFKIEFK